MRFLIAVVDSVTGTADADEIAAIDAFNDRLRAGGHWVFADGLESPDQAVVLDARGATVIRQDGPLVPSDEYLAGFWVIEAAGRDEALALAADASRSCQRKVEVRAFHHAG